MWMRGNATDVSRAQNVRGLDEVSALNNRQLKNSPHRTAHRPAKKWTGAGFTHKQRLHIESGTVADQCSQVFRAGQTIYRGEQPGSWAGLQNSFDRQLR